MGGILIGSGRDGGSPVFVVWLQGHQRRQGQQEEKETRTSGDLPSLLSLLSLQFRDATARESFTRSSA
jgi:hypothetical protein